MNAAEFIRRFPVLFHMTNGAAWPSIEKYGLLSPKAIYERQATPPDEIRRSLRLHRPESVRVGEFVLRDQMPLRQHNLICNLAGSKWFPADWHELLNSRVFFATKSKFVAELRDSYLPQKVTIITVDTGRLLQEYAHAVELSKFNNGAARLPNHTKGVDSFHRVAEFPYASNFQPRELTVDHSIPDIRPFLMSV